MALKKQIAEKKNSRKTQKKTSSYHEQYEYELTNEMMSDAIKQMRKKLGLNQTELGKLVGVRKAQISRIESGENSASLDTIQKLIKAMNANIYFSITVGGRYMMMDLD